MIMFGDTVNKSGLVKIEDILTHTLSTTCYNKYLKRNRLFPILHKGQKLPASGTISFQPTDDYQNEIIVDVYSGSSKDPIPENCLTQQAFKIYSGKADNITVKIKLNVDVNELVYVKAKQTSGNKNENIMELNIDKEFFLSGKKWLQILKNESSHYNLSHQKEVIRIKSIEILRSACLNAREELDKLQEDSNSARAVEIKRIEYILSSRYLLDSQDQLQIELDTFKVSSMLATLIGKEKGAEITSQLCKAKSTIIHRTDIVKKSHIIEERSNNEEIYTRPKLSTNNLRRKGSILGERDGEETESMESEDNDEDLDEESFGKFRHPRN